MIKLWLRGINMLQHIAFNTSNYNTIGVICLIRWKTILHETAVKKDIRVCVLSYISSTKHRFHYLHNVTAGFAAVGYNVVSPLWRTEKLSTIQPAGRLKKSRIPCLTKKVKCCNTNSHTSHPDGDDTKVTDACPQTLKRFGNLNSSSEALN